MVRVSITQLIAKLEEELENDSVTITDEEVLLLMDDIELETREEEE